MQPCCDSFGYCPALPLSASEQLTYGFQVASNTSSSQGQTCTTLAAELNRMPLSDSWALCWIVSIKKMNSVESRSYHSWSWCSRAEEADAVLSLKASSKWFSSSSNKASAALLMHSFSLSIALLQHTHTHTPIFTANPQP